MSVQWIEDRIVVHFDAEIRDEVYRTEVYESLYTVYNPETGKRVTEWIPNTLAELDNESTKLYKNQKFKLWEQLTYIETLKEQTK